MDIKFAVKISNNKLKIIDPRWVEWLYTAKNGIYMMTVKKPINRRTAAGNAYYWAAIVTPAAEYFGYTTEEMHEAFKMMFLIKHMDNGLPDTVKSTKSLSTVEFYEYVENVRRWLLIEHQFKTLDPNEVDV